ncbi:hypothetical protein N7463_010629 [Penicillium fimorum]|uniref:Uncharacterized protein n=1 Tax=Penicillium fimorum TaxID=1882269 RepID=A0A9X0C1H3_9EURO|nr:hypothetical protein N7463_010629 [Penicillium fimorum]
MKGNTWQQVRTYADHLGHRVVLEEYVVPDSVPDYLVPIQNDKVLPMFEIYSYRSLDAFVCIEYNRLEIARRKQQHRPGIKNALLLIPTFAGRHEKSILIGFCVLIRSHSYRLGETDEDKLGYSIHYPYAFSQFYPRYSRVYHFGKHSASLHSIDCLSPPGDEQSPTTHRMTPQYSDAYFIYLPYRLITVVLDRAKFFSEARVYFFKAYWDSTGDVDPYAEDDPGDTEVSRGVNLGTTAGPLGLVVLDR